jgi:hypothetical protein
MPIRPLVSAEAGEASWEDMGLAAPLLQFLNLHSHWGLGPNPLSKGTVGRNLPTSRGVHQWSWNLGWKLAVDQGLASLGSRGQNEAHPSPALLSTHSIH